VGHARLELATSPLSGVRSNQLSYTPLELALHTLMFCFQRTEFIGPWKLNRKLATHNAGLTELVSNIAVEELLLRKEVIQPQVPLRLPCYDFTPVTKHSLGTSFPRKG
jgi:hypothetical protein